MPAGLTSPVHLFVIILVALIVLGPEKLPHALRQVGRTMGEVRRWTDTISSEMRGVLSLDAGDEAPTVVPSSQPMAVPSPNGNGTVASAALNPAPAAPADPAGVDPSQHRALQEGGEWH